MGEFLQSYGFLILFAAFMLLCHLGHGRHGGHGGAGDDERAQPGGARPDAGRRRETGGHAH